jgi:AraC family transcriptional activator of pobA
MKTIPIHKLTDRATIGLEIRHTGDVDTVRMSESLGVHRDDHYIFFLVEQGMGTMIVDFTKIDIKQQSIFYVLPGQVHYRVDHMPVTGWFIAVETLLIPKEYRQVFENQLLLQQPYLLHNQQYLEYTSLISLLHQHYTKNQVTPFYTDVLRSLLNSFIGMAACGYSNSHGSKSKQTRPAQIAQQFKQILIQNIKTEKRPAAYANLLNISEAYLNEVLKKVTGFSVSYWVAHEVLLEAKRLLYYSPLNVKEIAHHLGYEDHTYFSRLFKKATGTTPLKFRDSHR